MLQDLIIVFIANFFAELGDKTQIAVFALSSKYENKWQVLAGSIAGLSLATALAVIIGGFLSQFIDLSLLKPASGILFIAFGIHFFISKDSHEERLKTDSNPFHSSFLLLFIMELGDKTQLANVLFASSLDPILVFVGAFLALGTISALAVLCGSKISQCFDKRLIHKMSAAVFLLIGLSMLLL